MNRQVMSGVIVNGVMFTGTRVACGRPLVSTTTLTQDVDERRIRYVGGYCQRRRFIVGHGEPEQNHTAVYTEERAKRKSSVRSGSGLLLSRASAVEPFWKKKKKKKKKKPGVNSESNKSRMIPDPLRLSLTSSRFLKRWL